MMSASSRNRVFIFPLLIIITFLTSCEVKREYVRTEFASASPNNTHFIYKIVSTHSSAGAWAGYNRFLYFSDDKMGMSQMPHPKESLIQAGVGCLSVEWKNDFEAKIGYCLSGYTKNEQKSFLFKGNKIVLNLERSSQCLLDKENYSISTPCEDML